MQRQICVIVSYT